MNKASGFSLTEMVVVMGVGTLVATAIAVSVPACS